MADTAERICAAAKKLSPRERLALVEQLLDSLDAPDSSMDVLWAAEAESRLEAYRRGEIEAIPLDDVLAKYASS
ncbi:MAG TPA: addiction module protein [Stellaceae bacterium]|nr:addiction module protein [Stellaceae bacterium]